MICAIYARKSTDDSDRNAEARMYEAFVAALAKTGVADAGKRVRVSEIQIRTCYAR